MRENPNSPWRWDARVADIAPWSWCNIWKNALRGWALSQACCIAISKKRSSTAGTRDSGLEARNNGFESGPRVLGHESMIGFVLITHAAIGAEMIRAVEEI